MATEIIPERTCPHCGGNKWVVREYKRKKNGNGVQYICAKMMNERVKAYLKKIGYEGYKKTQLKYKRSKRGKESQKRSNKRTAELLIDCYVILHLRNTGIENPTAEQINKYREHLKIIRKWKQFLKKGSKQ